MRRRHLWTGGDVKPPTVGKERLEEKPRKKVKQSQNARKKRVILEAAEKAKRPEPKNYWRATRATTE